MEGLYQFSCPQKVSHFIIIQEIKEEWTVIKNHEGNINDALPGLTLTKGIPSPNLTTFFKNECLHFKQKAEKLAALLRQEKVKHDWPFPFF